MFSDLEELLYDLEDLLRASCKVSWSIWSEDPRQLERFRENLRALTAGIPQACLIELDTSQYPEYHELLRAFGQRLLALQDDFGPAIASSSGEKLKKAVEGDDPEALKACLPAMLARIQQCGLPQPCLLLSDFQFCASEACHWDLSTDLAHFRDDVSQNSYFSGFLLTPSPLVKITREPCQSPLYQYYEEEELRA